MAKRADVYYWSQSLTYKTLAGGNFTRGYYIKVGASGSARITDVDTTTKVLAVNGVTNSSNFVDSATITEYSDSGLTLATGVTAAEDGSFTSSWIGPEDNQVKVRIDDSFMQPKFAEITIADFDNAIQNIGIYSAYKRVKIVENVANKPIFFGRVEFMNIQNQQGGTQLVLQCKDYLQELQESIIGHDFQGPVTLGALVKDIIDYHVFTKITYTNLAGVPGAFSIKDHDNAGYWIKVGTSPNFGYARLIYDDTVNKVLVLADVLNSEYFENGAPIVEFSDSGCTSGKESGETANQSGVLYHNIDTSSISAIGTISADTAANYLKSSSTPLEAISSLCLNAATDGIFSFCLEEGTDTSLFPPVFKLYLRETRPSVTPSTDGLTVRFNGTNGNQEREMQVDFSFPIPDKEIYTEVKASSVDEDNEQLSSVKKAGAKALELEICRQRVYQSLDHATQTGLDTSVDNFMSMTGNIVQRAEVSFAYYPYFYKSGAYTVVRAGDLVYIYNSRIAYAASGVNMVVTKIEYEEPTSTTRMSLKQITYGIGCPEYTYPNTQVGTEFPESIDTRIPDMAMAPWDDILPQSIQGYQHDIKFEPYAASEPYRTILITAGTITFYDGTTQSIDSIDSHGTTSYVMSTTGSPYPTIYMWFNIDSSRTAEQKETIVCGDLTAYKAALVAFPGMIGLLCMSRASTNTSDYAYVLPSYGKEPLINCDVIQMSSLKKFDYSTTPGTTTPEYLYSLQSTQITSGKITLSADTGISTAGAEMAPALLSANWTTTNGWSATSGAQEVQKLVRVDNASSGTATQTGGTAPAASGIYTVVITATGVSGSITYTLGGTAGGSSITTGTITDTVTATNTNKLVIAGAAHATGTITSISIKLQKSSWYTQNGVVVDANYGIAIYGTDMAFATFAAVGDYNSWLAHMKASDPTSARAHCQCYMDSAGKIYAGAGKVWMDNAGLGIIDIDTAIKFYHTSSANLRATMGWYEGNNAVALYTEVGYRVLFESFGAAAKTAQAILDGDNADAAFGGDSTITLQSDWVVPGHTGVVSLGNSDAHYRFSNLYVSAINCYGNYIMQGDYDIYPATTGQGDIGTSTYKFNNVYTSNVSFYNSLKFYATSTEVFSVTNDGSTKILISTANSKHLSLNSAGDIYLSPSGSDIIVDGDYYLRPATDSNGTLGHSSYYWKAAYTDALYVDTIYNNNGNSLTLDSTQYMYLHADNQIELTGGNRVFVPDAADTGFCGSSGNYWHQVCSNDFYAKTDATHYRTF